MGDTLALQSFEGIAAVNAFLMWFGLQINTIKFSYKKY